MDYKKSQYQFIYLNHISWIYDLGNAIKEGTERLLEYNTSYSSAKHYVAEMDVIRTRSEQFHVEVK